MLGPPTLEKTALQRIEHGLLGAALLALLAYVVWERGWTTWWRAAFWLVAPDLVFIPIAIGARSRGGRWPRWGVDLYNAAHTYASMIPAMAIVSVYRGYVVWPMLAWAAHIEVDRALGFDLRRWL